MKNNNIMKFITQKLMLFAACLFIAVSCKSEAVDFGNTDLDNSSSEELGFLAFSNLNVIVNIDSEIISKADDTNQEASDDYIVTIYSEKEESTVYTSTYGAIKALDKPIALTPGNYQVYVKSTSNEALCDWEAPYYSCTKSVTVVKNITTEINDLICKLSNIKTSLTFDASLNDLFQADDQATTPLNVNISLGDANLDFSRNDANRCGYFKAVEQSNSLVIRLSGMYNIAAADENPSYILIENWEQLISGVEAGQWRKINIRVENSNDGTITFIIDVQTWLYDENIDVDVMSQSYVIEEQKIEDPDDQTTDAGAPVITLANNHDIADKFIINESIFDFDAETCMDVIKAYATPTSGSTIASIDVTFSSENSAFMKALESAGFTDGMVSLMPTNSVSDYLTVREDNDQVVMTAKYTAMKALYSYAGEHTALIKIVDSEGRRSFTTFVMSVDPSASTGEGPSIVWRDGYDLNTRYDITASTTLPVILDMTSSTGITGFKIIITGVLYDEDKGVDLLTGMGLASEMDLINPANEEMKGVLKELDFPVGDDVEGATNLEFDITSFMPLLAMMGLGDSDFTLEVSDASGTTIRTLMVKSI